jgi:hypothetical protein
MVDNMKGLYIDPESQTIQEIVIDQENNTSVLSIKETTKLILDVDFVQKMWYNADYDLYCGDQQELSRHKKLHWFKYNVWDREQYVCNNAVLIPKKTNADLFGTTVVWVDEYTPPIQDFII